MPWILCPQGRALFDYPVSSAQELDNRADYRLLFVLAQLGEGGQGQDFAGGALGFGEAAFFIAEAVEKAGDRHMENKPAQNIQDTFLNTVRKDKTPITIYLVSGVKLTGKSGPSTSIRCCWRTTARSS
jgi:hypothetical protein